MVPRQLHQRPVAGQGRRRVPSAAGPLRGAGAAGEQLRPRLDGAPAGARGRLLSERREETAGRDVQVRKSLGGVVDLDVGCD